MTVTPKARQITEHIARAMQDPLTLRSIPEIVQGALDEAKEEGLQEGIHDCMMIRCTDHISAPQNNRNEITGAECGECARIQGFKQGVKWAVNTTGSSASPYLVVDIEKAAAEHIQ